MERKDKCLCYACLNYDKEKGCCSKIYRIDHEYWKETYRQVKKLDEKRYALVECLMNILEVYELLSSK